MNRLNTLRLETHLPVRAQNGGLFVSRGKGKHPDRVINSHELIFVRTGTLGIQEAQSPFVVSAGETLLLFPNRRHQGLTLYKDDLSYFWLHFEVSCEAKGKASTAQYVSVPQHAHMSRPDNLTLLFRQFLSNQEAGAPPYAASLLVMLMLAEVAGSSPSVNPVGNGATVLASRADALIRTRFHEPLSTSAIANELRSNPDYLGRTFRQVYGRTLTQAIHARRLKHARKLLLNSEQTVESVAQACGFGEVGYFRRLFKRAEGMTPHKFRALYAKVHINTE